jgi:PPE-repeat protein
MIPSFTFLPPEVNSFLMFAGEGSGPMFAAGAAWDGLSADLAGAASSFSSVISGLLDGTWTGPASLSMAAAAAPYMAWLNLAAEHAASAGVQARVAATAFETARAATVPTAAVTANRTQLMALIATNFLGQNAGMIAMTELQYFEMWLQDVLAMVGYHGGAMSVASVLPQFSAPPASLPGLNSLMATTASAATTAAAASSPLSGLGGGLAGLGSVAQEALSALPLSSLSSLASPLASVAEVGVMPISMAISPLMSVAQGAGHIAPALADATGPVGDTAKFVGSATPAMKGLGGAGGLGDIGGGLGHARLVGAMSVPPTWEGSMPGKMISSAMSGMGGATPLTAPAGPTGGGMPMMPMPMGAGAGGGMPGGALGRGGASPHVTQNRPSVIPRSGVG